MSVTMLPKQEQMSEYMEFRASFYSTPMTLNESGSAWVFRREW